ncbi:MAG: SH3 domain-containing protein [Desulfobaccales bacterium]
MGLFNGRSGAWICALGLVICLIGCQTQVSKVPPSPPPLPPKPAQPKAVRSTFYVTTNQLSLRACPGIDCKKITTLKLNAEVEKMGESQNWTQIKVKKDGTIGYVSSRYLSPQPVEVAHLTKKKPKKTKSPKATQPPEVPMEAGKAWPKNPEPEPPIPRVM